MKIGKEAWCHDYFERFHYQLKQMNSLSLKIIKGKAMMRVTPLNHVYIKLITLFVFTLNFIMVAMITLKSYTTQEKKVRIEKQFDDQALTLNSFCTINVKSRKL